MTAGGDRSVFVAMPWSARLMVGLLFALPVTVTVVQASRRAYAGYEWVVAGLLLFALLRALPLIFYRPTLGWFHPLVAGALFELPNLYRRVGVWAGGMRWHLALPHHDAPQLNRLVAIELWLGVLGLLCMYFGYRLAPVGRPLPLRFGMPRRVAPRSLLLCLVALGIFVTYLASRGGVVGHLMSWGDGGRHESLKGQFVLLTLSQLGGPACLVWLALSRAAYRNPLFWLCNAVALGVHFLALGGRANLVYHVAIALGVWMLRGGRVSLRVAVVCAALALPLLNQLGQFRRSTWGHELDVAGALEFSFVDSMADWASGELSERATTASGSLPVLAHVPDQVEPLYGLSYFAAFVVYIPSRLWPTKPGLIDGRVGRTFFGLHCGIPPGAVAEAWWNFMLPGVVLIFMLHGVFLRWMAAQLRRYPHAPVITLVYMTALVHLRTPTSAATVSFVLSAVPMLLLARAVGALSFQPRRPWSPPLVAATGASPRTGART